MLRRLAPLLALAPLLPGCATDEADELDLDTCDAPEVYRVSRVDLPVNSAEAGAAGFDLNGDASVDNQLGQVIATLHGQFDPPLEEPANAHLARDVDWRVSLRRCPGDRRAVALHDAKVEPAYLVIEPGDIVARGRGGVDLPLGALFDGLGTATDPGWITADIAAIELGTGTASTLALRIGLGLEARRSSTIITTAYAPFLDATLDDNLRGELDANGDGTITAAELAASSIARALLAPDLALRDGRDGLSLGLRLDATPL